MSPRIQARTDAPRPDWEHDTIPGGTSQTCSTQTDQHRSRRKRLDISAVKHAGSVISLVSLLGLLCSGRIDSLFRTEGYGAAARSAAAHIDESAQDQVRRSSSASVYKSIASLFVIAAICVSSVILIGAQVYGTTKKANAEAHATITAADAEARAKQVTADAEAHAERMAADAEAHAKQVVADAQAAAKNNENECLMVIVQDLVHENSYGASVAIKSHDAEVKLNRAHASRRQGATTDNHPPYRVINGVVRLAKDKLEQLGRLLDRPAGWTISDSMSTALWNSDAGARDRSAPPSAAGRSERSGGNVSRTPEPLSATVVGQRSSKASTVIARLPRVLGRLVREWHWLTLPEAVCRMTSLPAWQLKLRDRGLVREAMVADFVLFNPQTAIDRSTFAEPERLAEGIEKVYVSGVLVWDHDHATAARPGRVLPK